MKKKLIIGFGIFVMLIGTTLLLMNYSNRTKSPPGKELFAKNELTISIDYSRPSVRERLIFGSESDGALLPYGEYWRLGANEGTEFEINSDFSISGNPLNAGRYRIYAIPEEGFFKIVVSTELGRWGYSEPDHDKDLFGIDAPINNLENAVEQFTCEIKDSEGGANLVFSWDKTSFELPLTISE